MCARVFLHDESDVSLTNFIDFLLTITRKLVGKKYDIYFREYFVCRSMNDIRFSYVGKYSFPNSDRTSNSKKSIIENSPYVKIFRYPNTDFSLKKFRYDCFELVYDKFSANFFDTRSCVEVSTEEYAEKLFRVFIVEKNLREI